MLNIDGHSIEVTRGDSVRLMVHLKGREFPEGTKAVFTVKDTVWEPCRPVIEKVMEVMDGAVSVILEPGDTDIVAGHYVWDLRLKEPSENGMQEVLTPMEYAAFRVLEAIGE